MKTIENQQRKTTTIKQTKEVKKGRKKNLSITKDFKNLVKLRKPEKKT